MSLCDRNNTIFAEGIDPSWFEEDLDKCRSTSSDGDSDTDSEPESAAQLKKARLPLAVTTPESASQLRYSNDTPRSRPEKTRKQTSTSQSPSATEASIASALAQVTNTLNKVVQRLDKTEEKLSSMEDLLTSSSSSGPRSPKSRKGHKIPPAVRGETRKMYQTLLDEDTENFPGFKTDPEFTFKHADNQAIVGRIIKEVQRENHTFIAADIRNAIYTYYKSLCQEESLKRRGKSDARKIQRRRRERITRKLQERTAAFQKITYTPKDRDKWAKMLTVDMMSSEESDESDDAIIVRPLQWRHDRVTNFLHTLDERSFEEKSPQAKRQTKERKQARRLSLRPLPTEKYSSWAIATTQ